MEARMVDVSRVIGAEARRVEDRERDGRPVHVVVAERTYATDVADLWDAITNPARIPRWFAPVEGELRLGGRYQVQGNASGTITRCDPPEAFDLTWEFGGGVSWVSVRLAPEGGRTRLTLEHTAPVEPKAEEHWNQYGPGAVGVGWELGLFGLGLHIDSGGSRPPEDNLAWMASVQAKAFMREAATAWGEAHVAGGADPEVARGMAERTAAAYAPG
jgi:uncharacterized protein YndB with AHSA1/START domain